MNIFVKFLKENKIGLCVFPVVIFLAGLMVYSQNTTKFTFSWVEYLSWIPSYMFGGIMLAFGFFVFLGGDE